MRRMIRIGSGRSPTTPSTFVHEYLADSYEAFTPWAKHREVYDFDESQSFEPYDKDTILEYLAFCQRHVAERVPQLKLAEPEGMVMQ
jgi:hypothetical protein